MISITEIGAGGGQPIWSKDGKELFSLGPDGKTHDSRHQNGLYNGDRCPSHALSAAHPRESLWSIHVDPGIDPSRTTVTTTVSGGTGAITLVPKDKYGNNLGPGRGDGFTVTGEPGTTVTGVLRRNFIRGEIWLR